jgi:hypothetical protein
VAGGPPFSPGSSTVPRSSSAASTGRNHDPGQPSQRGPGRQALDDPRSRYGGACCCVPGRDCPVVLTVRAQPVGTSGGTVRLLSYPVSDPGHIHRSPDQAPERPNLRAVRDHVARVIGRADRRDCAPGRSPAPITHREREQAEMRCRALNTRVIFATYRVRGGPWGEVVHLHTASTCCPARCHATGLCWRLVARVGCRGIHVSRERRAWAGGGFPVHADGSSVEATDRTRPGDGRKGGQHVCAGDPGSCVRRRAGARAA